MLEIKNISLSYDGLSVFNNFSCKVENGSFISVLGPSGSGKSSLGAIIAGHLSPQSGEVLLDGTSILGKPSRNIWLVNQVNDLFPWQTVEEHLRFVNPNCDIEKTLSCVQLLDSKKKFPKELSGGMKKRLAIARALALSPRVLILDEVFNSQDEDLRLSLLQSLAEVWKKEGTTVLAITHDPEFLKSFYEYEIKITRIAN